MKVYRILVEPIDDKTGMPVTATGKRFACTLRHPEGLSPGALRAVIATEVELLTNDIVEAIEQCES